MEPKKMESDSSHPSGDDSVARSGSKHTPGPWTLKHSLGAGLGIWADASKALGDRYSKDCPVYHVNPDAPSVQIAYELWTQFPRDEWNAMQEANGRLMAAAPDLLDALQGCMEYLSCIPESAVGGDDDAAALCRIARAAIARATGAPQ